MSAPADSPSTPEAPSKSHVSVTASPKTAQIYVDDAAVANPYVADQVRDAVSHRLRVEAPGYRPKIRTIAFGDDVDLQITLDAARAATAARRTTVQANPPPIQKSNCQPPYIVDLETGKTRWRLECL